LIYRFAEFELDAGLFELRREGAPVPVQPKVLALLLHLVRHRARTVRKDELFSALWPAERVGEASLPRAVRGARRALGDDGQSQRAIRSVRGVGYRFVRSVVEVAGPDGQAAVPVPAPPPPSALPIVGREAPLAQLGPRLAEARAGRGGIALVFGTPGIGKTRLVDEVAARARADGIEVLVGRGHEGDGAPAYWPWLQIVRGYVAARGPEALRTALGAGAADVARALPGLAALPAPAAGPPIAPDQLRFRLHDSMAGFLARAAADRPLLVVLDDLQQADLPSLQLLRFLIRELTATPVLFLATCRPPGSIEPARRALVEGLARGAPEACIELAGLEPDAVARLMEAATGAAPAPSAVADLHQRTGGNPLFVTALLALEAGGARAANPLAPGLEAAIERHLEGLSARGRDALRAAAVLGREFALPVLARMLDVAPAALLEEFGAAEAARVIEPTDAAGVGWRFAHGLIPEVIQAGLAPAARVALHARAGAALAAHCGDDDAPHLTSLAHHFTQAASAGGAERALAYAERVAARAMAQAAWEEAAGWWERVLGLLELSGAGAERRVEALLSAAAAWQFASDAPRARERERRALDIARAVGSAPLFARAVLGARAEEETGQVDPQRVALLEEALRRLGPGDGPLRVRLASRLASALYFADPETRHIEVCREAVAMARRIGDRAALGAALFKLHFARLDPDGLAERALVAAELASLAAETGDVDLRARSLMTAVVDSLERGDRPGLDAALEAHAALADRLRHPTMAWRSRLWQAMRALLAGRIPEAEALADAALRDGQRLSHEIAFEWYGVQIYQVRREQERLAELEPAVARLAALYPAIATWPAALALLEAEQGRTEEARRRVRAFADARGLRLRRDINALVTLAVLAETCRVLGDAALASLVEAALAPYAGRQILIGVASAGYGAVDRYLGLLSATLDRVDEAIARLEAGRRSDAAMGAEGLAAHGAVDLARVLAARGAPGDRARAQALADEARDAAARLGSARLARRAAALAAELQGAIPLRRRRRGGGARGGG
jgi:predicted ATPase/DNA-binding winged helix-turn-helix (wHTH) protein